MIRKNRASTEAERVLHLACVAARWDFFVCLQPGPVGVAVCTVWIGETFRSGCPAHLGKERSTAVNSSPPANKFDQIASETPRRTLNAQRSTTAELRMPGGALFSSALQLRP